jgi:hypothetical protein
MLVTPNAMLKQCQPGEFVLFLYSVKGNQKHKLDSKHLGPFKVVSHLRNDVTVRNLVTAWTGRNAVNHTFVKMWGSKVILTDKMTLIDLDFINTHKLIEKLA